MTVVLGPNKVVSNSMIGRMTGVVVGCATGTMFALHRLSMNMAKLVMWLVNFL